MSKPSLLESIRGRLASGALEIQTLSAHLQTLKAMEQGWLGAREKVMAALQAGASPSDMVSLRYSPPDWHGRQIIVGISEPAKPRPQTEIPSTSNPPPEPQNRNISLGDLASVTPRTNPHSIPMKNPEELQAIQTQIQHIDQELLNLNALRHRLIELEREALHKQPLFKPNSLLLAEKALKDAKKKLKATQTSHRQTLEMGRTDKPSSKEAVLSYLALHKDVLAATYNVNVAAIQRDREQHRFDQGIKDHHPELFGVLHWKDGKPFQEVVYLKVLETTDSTGAKRKSLVVRFKGSHPSIAREQLLLHWEPQLQKFVTDATETRYPGLQIAAPTTTLSQLSAMPTEMVQNKIRDHGWGK